MKNLVMAATVLCLGGMAWSARAQEQSGTEEQVEMERIGVTGKRDSLPAYSAAAVAESARISTEVIGREEIEAIHPRDFYDLLTRAAGVESTFQGRKIMNFASVRGGQGLGIILDGFYIPSAQVSRIMAQFPMDTIESIRVVRDSTSLTLGPLMSFASPLSAPNQGYVIITTRKGTRPEGGVAIEYGSLDTREFQLRHGNRIGPYNYRLTGTANGTNGRKDWYNDQKAMSILFNGGYDGPSLKVSTTLFYEYGKRDMQRALAYNTTSNSKWSYDPLEALWMAVSINKLWNPGQVTSLSYSHGMVHDKEVMATFAKPQVATVNAQGDYADNYHLWHTASFGSNTLKTGFQATWWHEPSGYAPWDGKDREETLIGGYVQDEQRLLSDKLSLDAGVRVDDKYIKKGIDKYSPTQTTTALIEDKWTTPVIGASLGASYKIDKFHTLSARFGYSYAETDSFVATLDNKDLGPEERYKYEAGIAANYHPAFNPKLTLFYYDVRNYKVTVGASGTGINAVNIYDASTIGMKGLELSTTGSLPRGFDYTVNYSYYESTLDSDNDYTPHDTVTFLLGHTYGPVKTNVSLRYISPYTSTQSQFAVDKQLHQVGGFTRLDANVSYAFMAGKLDGRLTAYAGNLLNDKYETIYGWPDVGTTYGLRLEAGF